MLTTSAYSVRRLSFLNVRSVVTCHMGAYRVAPNPYFTEFDCGTDNWLDTASAYKVQCECVSALH